MGDFSLRPSRLCVSHSQTADAACNGCNGRCVSDAGSELDHNGRVDGLAVEPCRRSEAGSTRHRVVGDNGFRDGLRYPDKLFRVQTRVRQSRARSVDN